MFTRHILWTCLLALFFCQGIFAQTERKDSLCLETKDSLYYKTKHIKEPVTRLADLTQGLKKAYEVSTQGLIYVGHKLNDVDTTYISPNKYNFAFMLEQSTWFEHYRLGGNKKDGEQSINFAPNANFKIGLYFGWRWIFLGVTFDVKDLLGKHKSENQKNRKEVVFNLYSSKFGVDVYSRKTGSDFKITSYSGFDLDQNYENTDFEGFQSKIKGLNAYWIFNHRKFSYPAAYSQSTNQRKSCGSLMAGFSYSDHRITFDHTLLPEEMQENMRPSLQFKKMKYTDYNISVGYGYNWVFAKNCLLNLSLLPGIGFKKARIDEKTNETEAGFKHWIRDMNFDLITRAGLTWNNSKYYVGASLVLHTYDYRKENFSMTNSFGSLRIYLGLNFWKKKEYKQNYSK